MEPIPNGKSLSCVITGQTPPAFFGREIRLPCDLQFDSKPSETEAIGDEYVENFLKKLNSIHEDVCSNLQIASDKIKEWYNINAQAGGYQAGDL